MKGKYVFYGVLALVTLIGYNSFLIRRDAALFESTHARACEQVKSFHPDCAVYR